VSRSSVLVTAVGFERNLAETLAELARHCLADEADFKGKFNLWLHFDNLDLPAARVEVRRSLEALMDQPEAHYMF
jgi:hypothetical protein